jgi:Methylmalonyl-CoA mutase, N-terminal domain/subunit
MTDQQMKFVEGFTLPTYEEWVAEVEKALKGAPFDKRMYTKTYEGVTLRPIYTPQDWPSAGDPSGFPGATPFTRGSTAAGGRVNGWDFRQAYLHPDPAKGNEIILHELTLGVTSLLLQFDLAARAGLDGDDPAAAETAGQGGVMLYCLDDLDRLLTGVQLDLAPVALRAGAQFLPAASLLMALWQRRRTKPADAKGAFNADPLGTLAATGSLPTDIASALAQAAALAKYTAATYPQVSAVAVDSSPYHDAGATETVDLAASMATALAYLKAMTDAGMSIDDACRQIQFVYAVPADQFLGICKLRAARKLWARVAEACGASEPARAMRLHAVSAYRMMSQRDPWVNMLRTTVACFAAAVGGADAITINGYDAVLGGPGDDLGRRIARNTQIVLNEESNLSKVIDAGGGSWYIEARTDELAKLAWGEFQAIEKAGGIVQSLTDGSLAEKIAGSYAQREANLAKRRDPLTGVSEFPNIGEAPVERESIDFAALRSAAAGRLGAKRGSEGATSALAGVKPGSDGLVAASVAAAVAGASVAGLAKALAGTAASITALPKHRLAEKFEAQRDASDAFLAKTGNRPKIFLANLGAIAQHTGRATFAKNFFEVAGIETVSNEGFSDPAACAAAFTSSGAKIAILCSSDGVYEQLAVPTAQALKAAGCSFLFLAGAPGDKKDAYNSAGIDDFIFMGCDLLKITNSALAHLGVI